MRILILALLATCVCGKSAPKGREGRFFRGTYTETKVQTDMVTSLIPSSCIHVEATLPPCRSVRNLQTFPEFVGRSIYPDYMKGRQLSEPENVTVKQLIVLPPANETKVVSWAEYLGLVAPTVTVTAVELHTTTVQDPRTVVTFSVKGCRPSRLPMDLDRCPVPPSPIAADEISPSAVSNNMLASSIARSLNDLGLGDEGLRSMDLESSALDFGDINLSAVPTEELSTAQ